MKLIFLAAISAVTISSVTPDSVLKTARAVGDYAGYKSSPMRKMDYELTDQPGRPLYSGFITAQVMSNGHDIFNLSVRNKDGEVFDFNHCFVIEYPFLRRRGKKSQLVRSKDYHATMEANGCVNFRILRRPGDEGLP